MFNNDYNRDIARKIKAMEQKHIENLEQTADDFTASMYRFRSGRQQEYGAGGGLFGAGSSGGGISELARPIGGAKKISKGVKEYIKMVKHDLDSSSSKFSDEEPLQVGSSKPKAKKVNKRAEIVKKIMTEKGLKMIDASKYVKDHNLYKSH